MLVPRPPLTRPLTLPAGANLNASLAEPPVRFSTAEKRKAPTVPALAPVIDQVLAAFGPSRVSAAEVLPTSFSMLAKPPVLVAVWVARLTVAAAPPSAE